MQVIVRTNILLLQHLSSLGLLNKYAHFLQLKYKHSNSLYYNYSINNVKAANTQSRSTIAKLLTFFIKRGWCIEKGYHLAFISLEDMCLLEGLHAKSNTKINIDDKTTSAIKLQLLKLLFEDNLRKQEYVIKHKNNLLNPKTLRAHKAAKRSERAGLNKGEHSNVLLTTLKSMAKIMHCSIPTAARIRRAFTRNKWYGFVTQYKKITCGITQYGYQRGLSPYIKGTFLFKGNLYMYAPSIVIRY